MILSPETDKLIDSQRSKEEVLDVLSIYKDRIIYSFKCSDPISQLHCELHCRPHLPYDELLEWRADNYTSTNNRKDALLDFDTTQQIYEKPWLWRVRNNVKMVKKSIDELDGDWWNSELDLNIKKYKITTCASVNAIVVTISWVNWDQ